MQQQQLLDTLMLQGMKPYHELVTTFSELVLENAIQSGRVWKDAVGFCSLRKDGVPQKNPKTVLPVADLTPRTQVKRNSVVNDAKMMSRILGIIKSTGETYLAAVMLALNTRNDERVSRLLKQMVDSGLLSVHDGSNRRKLYRKV